MNTGTEVAEVHGSIPCFGTKCCAQAQRGVVRIAEIKMARAKEVCVPSHIAGTSTQCRQSWHVSAITRPYVRPRAIFMEGCNRR